MVILLARWEAMGSSRALMGFHVRERVQGVLRYTIYISFIPRLELYANALCQFFRVRYVRKGPECD